MRLPAGGTGRKEHTIFVDALKFLTRDACVNCRCDDTIVVWRGIFDGPSCAEYLDRFGYAVPWRESIANEPFALVRCVSCDMVFHSKILSDESLRTLYSDWIDDSQTVAFNQELGEGFDTRFRRAEQLVKHVLRIRKIFPGTDSLSVLDYGCGDGSFLRVAAAFGFRAVGLDLSTTRHDQAAESGTSIFSNLSEVDRRQAGEFNAATMFQVLEHLAEPLDVLLALHKRLVKGGVLIIEVPDCRGITTPDDFESFRNVHPLEHINAFTPTSLQKICERAGFRSIKKPTAYVTTSARMLPKTALSRFVAPPTTQRYFRRI